MVLEGMVSKRIEGEWIWSQETNFTQRAGELESLVNGRDKINEASPKEHPTLLSTENSHLEHMNECINLELCCTTEPFIGSSVSQPRLRSSSYTKCSFPHNKFQHALLDKRHKIR